MRHLVTSLLNETASSIAREVDDFRWHRPVRPGDTLHVQGEVGRTEPSESIPTLGYVNYRCAMTNQDDEIALSKTGLLLIRRRNHGS